jgi:structural maintenance of chromosomes protein 6
MPASRKRRSQRNDDDDEAMVEAAEAVVAAAAAAQEEEAEEEEQEAETEEGAITPSPPKRSRRNNSNNGENDENNANMTDVQQEQEEEEEAQQEQEEEERAYNDDDNDNNNSNRNDNSRRIMHSPSSAGRQSINAPGKQAECGIIQQVYVENFMCHKKLRVDLCANVNFIHGQNGSGKSAILAAIQICLGAGARRTHRARNLKELIRKETSSGMAPSCAKVQVKLLNRGDDGYKPEVYGSTIIVERTIQLKSGGGGGYNGYKLLDEHGVEKSRSKRDLDEMLDMLYVFITISCTSLHFSILQALFGAMFVGRVSFNHSHTLDFYYCNHFYYHQQ